MDIPPHFGREPFDTWHKNGFDRHILQGGPKRDPRLADTPTLFELMDQYKTPEVGRQLTIILRQRSPRATAVATSAMLRTCAVRLPAMKLTESEPSFHVILQRQTPAPDRPACSSVPTSRATRVTSPAKAFSWSTIVLIVSFNSRISPFTSTVILRERSPPATAVVTSAILRTWPVNISSHRID